MTETSDTTPAPSADAAPTVETILLAGLTAGGDENAALSVLRDVHRELEALSELLGLDLDGAPLDRPATLTLLDGIERRFRAGLGLLCFAPMVEAPAPAPESAEEDITRDAMPEGAS